MFKNIKIGTKINLVVILVVLLGIVTTSFITYNLNKKSIEEKYLGSLSVIAQSKAEKINDFFVSITDATQHLRNQESLKTNLGYYRDYYMDEPDSIMTLIGFNMEGITSPFMQYHSFSNVIITEKSGEIVYTANSSDPEQSVGGRFKDRDGKTLSESKEEIYYSEPFEIDGNLFLYVGAPLVDDYNMFAGMAFIKVSLQNINNILNDYKGLGDSGESFLVSKKGNKVLLINKGRHEGDIADGILLGDKTAVSFQRSIEGKSGSLQDIDLRNNEVLATWAYVPMMKWGVVSKIDTREIYKDARKLLFQFLVAGAIVMAIALLIAIIFARILTNPLISLKETLKLLGKGVLPNKVQRSSNDEIGEMSDILNNLVQSLRDTANFAKSIGEGDFEAEFQPLSDDDTLGTALINMRENIQEAEKRDRERNWIVTGVAEIGEILRRNDELEALGDEILVYVTDKINAIQGAFYVVNDDNGEDIFIEMKSSYAYHKKKYMNARFKFAEGLVGQSAIEQDTLLRTEIPYDYVTVTSGLLGDKRPTCILLVPLITDERVYGVLEFAGFEKFNSSQIKFVEEISVIIARTVFNIKVNERTRRLLEESRTMSAELQEQQEILRQNAEEMEATQEELKRTNQRLEDQIEEVNRTQKRMQLLLENASEVITIYEEDRKVRYISPSVEKILGYTQNELIGFSDIDKVHEENKETFQHMFEQLLAHPTEQVTLQYQYKRQDGDFIWVETTGTNMLADAAIQGIIVNTRDITEKRRAEQEERMRSKMQALSENSPDLITRIDNEGKFFYINPMIETYTGKKPDQFLQRKIDEVELEPAIVEEWMKVLSEVKESNAKVSDEMDFPSVIGDRIMQINAIPEYDEDEHLESVLVVSHDITKQKMIQLEIQSKNKKITESINYARRIQGAILPDNSVINKQLPESFIFYKAKDVVSGDFPWYMQVGDDIYIAAVDCTGHGVPGALISLIGYFLLNDIVRSQKISEPGIILDMLDEGVTQTLRQDTDESQTKDGMDIALCKINLKKQELEFAGAHRPLYYLKNNDLEEFKGNKFPIGGGIYRNQTKFTNHKIKFSKGESVFFCSDGFPDQFGGPDNRKFGPKRLRELIVAQKNLSMDKMHKVFDQEWEGWKGDQKQTDDVLLIGIRF